jgi:hypothetical protein
MQIAGQSSVGHQAGRNDVSRFALADGAAAVVAAAIWYEIEPIVLTYDSFG